MGLSVFEDPKFRGGRLISLGFRGEGFGFSKLPGEAPRLRGASAGPWSRLLSAPGAHGGGGALGIGGCVSTTKILHNTLFEVSGPLKRAPRDPEPFGSSSSEPLNT